MFLSAFKNLKKFKKYFMKYKKTIIALLIVMVIASSFGVLISYFLSEQLIGITNQDANMAVKFTIIILIAVTIHHINWYLWSRFHFKLARDISKDIKNDVTKNLLDTQYVCIKNNNTGYYLERLNNDIDEISSFLGNVAGVFVDVITNLSFLVIIYFLNWQLGLMFTIGIIILFLIECYKIKLNLKNIEKVKISTEQTNSSFNEVIYGIKDIKGFGLKTEIISKMDKLNSNLLLNTYKKNNQFELLSRLGTYLQWIIDSCLVLITMLVLLPQGQISIIILLLIFNYKSLMYDTVGFFSKLKGYYVNGDYYAKRVLEIIECNEKEIFGKKEMNEINNIIVVKNLTYKFDDKKILDNINLEFKPHTLNVLVGNSGSGKSTLFMLLSKLYMVDNDKIFYNNIDINDISEDSFRKNVCIMNQESFIFHDTVMNNIRIVNSNATEEEIYNVCKKANIYDEIIAMEKGFDTILMEGGSNLSGGQKQRLELARCYLKNSNVLLLDEPTSALDSYNQDLLFRILNDLKKEKTIVIIAHKLSSYESFDSVYELKNAQIEKIK